jgi:translocation and assembly module TamA
MRANRFSQILFICITLFCVSVYADEVEYVVNGVDEPMLTNVFNHVSVFRIGTGVNINGRIRRRMLEETKVAVTDAMRPYGYFHPAISVGMSLKEAGKWVVAVDVRAGPPVLVEKLKLELTGSGQELARLVEWYKAFPVAEGQVLNQQAWDKTKQDAVNLLEEEGYLQARFSSHVISVNPMINTARLELVLDTGPQATMGEVTFKQDILNDTVLASIQRFKYGDAYNAWLLEKFRQDLWRSGYFEEIEVIERRELSANPPRVKFDINFEPRKKDTYQGTIGYGTDTLARLQLRWSRHLLSPRGDKIDIAFGWQQKDNEFSIQSNYRLPRKTETRQFWVATVGFKSETQSLDVSASEDLENRITIARGNITDYFLRLSRARVRNMHRGYRQFFETIFVQALNEKRNFDPTGNIPEEPYILDDPDSFSDLLKSTSNSLSVGLDWDWPEIRGSGFETTGHHERAWLFTSNEAWGSDVNFSQAYISSRWNFLAGNHWKFLLRAEAGYSHAKTTRVEVPTQEDRLDISVSELPYLYRFKAGGSNSVRGYAFEQLDENGLGSNNVLTASAEVEYHFHKNWSVAAFVDTGNAFRDWSDPELKTGTGLGLRWYSIIGAVRLDVAQGWDLEGDPWRIHLTIGTVLF